VSHSPTPLSRGLAAAFLNGPWGINALVARGVDALGRRARGLLQLARAVIRQFPEPPHGRVDDLSAFIDEVSTLRTVRIRHWHFPDTTMLDPLAALAELAIPQLTCVGDLATLLEINPAQLAWLADTCGGHGLAPAGEWQKVRSAGKLWRYDKKEFSIWRDAL
jgi:hypothetical protein